MEKTRTGNGPEVNRNRHKMIFSYILTTNEAKTTLNGKKLDRKKTGNGLIRFYIHLQHKL